MSRTTDGYFGSAAWPSDWDEVLMLHPHSGVRIGLLRHPSNDGAPFSEFRTGLDHVELEVASPRELERWRRRLEEAGWLASDWQPSENNRRAKYYKLTRAGRRQLSQGHRLVVVPGDGEAARVFELTQVADRLTTTVIE